jgi:hypothetical protein
MENEILHLFAKSLRGFDALSSAPLSKDHQLRIGLKNFRSAEAVVPPATARTPVAGT